MATEKLYVLIGPDGGRVTSSTPGTLGGYRKERGYEQQRVFFADEATAIAAGYHPCRTCMPDEYKAWKAKQK